MLPLWNFFKVCDTGELKYLFVAERIEYDVMPNETSDEIRAAWEKIIEQYSNLENQSTGYHRSLRSKLAFRWALYLEEQAMIRHLMFETNLVYINRLRGRGYNIPSLAQYYKQTYTPEEISQFSTKELIDINTKWSGNVYWPALLLCEKRVHYHVSQMEMLKLQIKRENEAAENRPKDTFYKVISWFHIHGIMVLDTLTVAHYVELKRTLNKKIEDSKKKRR